MNKRRKKRSGRLGRPDPKTHWVTLENPKLPVCGERRNGTKVTHEQDLITCGRCLRLLGIEVDTSGNVPEFLKNDPLHMLIATRALDSLLGRAFQDTEARFVELCARARRALAAWEGPGTSASRFDEGENMADVLRGFLSVLGRSD